MQDLKKVEVKLTVLEETEKALQKAAKAVDFTVGEVIDRMTLNWRSEDVVYTAQLFMEDFVMNTSHLDTNKINEVLYFVLSTIELCKNDYSTENVKKAIEERFALKQN